MDFRYFEKEVSPTGYLQAGWDWLNQILNWAQKYNIFVILDMHTPQGGYQSFGYQGKFWGNTADDINNRTRFKNLWLAIATRYKNNSTIAAYDLINEPMPTNNTAY